MVNRNTKYKFPLYQSSKDALSEGLAVPVYDPTKPRKHWVDPNPKTNEDGECEYKVFATKGNMVQVDPTTGFPKFKTIRMSVEEAKSFNIYDPEFHNSQTPDTEVGSIPPPIRELKSNEGWKFGFLSEPEIVTIENKPVQIVPTNSEIILDKLDVLEEKLNRIIVVLGSK